jgi:hypothetical protein
METAVLGIISPDPPTSNVPSVPGFPSVSFFAGRTAHHNYISVVRLFALVRRKATAATKAIFAPMMNANSQERYLSYGGTAGGISFTQMAIKVSPAIDSAKHGHFHTVNAEARYTGAWKRFITYILGIGPSSKANVPIVSQNTL